MGMNSLATAIIAGWSIVGIGTAVLLFLPYRNDRVEIIAVVFIYLCVPISVLLLMAMLARFADQPLKRIVLGIFSIIMLLVFAISALKRVETATRYRWDVHGRVTRKYQDETYHNYNALDVQIDQDRTVTLLGISQSAWNIAEPGARVDKDPWFAVGSIGNRQVNFVE